MALITSLEVREEHFLVGFVHAKRSVVSKT